MPPDERPALLCFRQDLRLDDHAALTAAVRSGRPVAALYVFDSSAGGAWAIGAASRWWLHHSLESLGGSLEAMGGRLVLRAGPWATTVLAVAREINAAEVHAGLAIEPSGRTAEQELGAALTAEQRAWRPARTATLFDPETIRSKTGGVYGVYSAFMRACRAQGVAAPVAPPTAIRWFNGAIDSDRLDDWELRPTKPDWAEGMREAWMPGEDAAHSRMHRFVAEGLAGYDTTRNLPARVMGTSSLSPHLHFGEISPVRAWDGTDVAGTPETFHNELIWREFSAYLLWHHPQLPNSPLRAEYARMPWRRDVSGLHAWKTGRTGVPIVDAGMRQLWRIGWMHNRVRMITASFLVKHLLLPWQDGEAWFWDTLVDADLASNAASWQWVAGCGADAAPFFRVFNPVLQGQKFDPDGDYVRTWVPELSRLPTPVIHAPWLAAPMELEQAGVRLGTTYPRPIVDLAEGRVRALAALKTITGKAA